MSFGSKIPRRSQCGFTLIELMIAVAVVAILSAIAIPSYRQFVIRGNRAAAQSEMMNAANQEQQYLPANRAYADQGTLGFALSSDVSPYYTYGLTLDETLDNSCNVVASAIPSFVITLTAIGSQVSDGDLHLSSDGTKCPNDKW